jgi:predicted porin
MKKLLSILLLTSFSLASYAGGHAMSDNGHSAMSSAKSSSGVHFYGRMYVGYDDRQVGSGSADDESLEDGGNKSRLGLKFKENLGGGLQLIGQLEYKFDGIDGTSEDNTTDCNSTDDCRTFNLHVGNLGFKTAYGYIGAGTYETPYKTMGQFDHNIDTAWAMNQHGATSTGNAGIDGNAEGMIAYHNQMGPLELSYMVAVNDSTPAANVTNNANTNQGDYAMGLQLKDMFMPGLVMGYSRSHSQTNGTSNDRFYASMKVLPNAGVFVSLEDLQVAGSYSNISGAQGDVTTIGTHYSMGSTDLQVVYAKGDSDGAATQDYKTLGLSAKMNLSKTSDLTFGYAKQDFDSTGSDVTTRGIGLTHRF